VNECLDPGEEIMCAGGFELVRTILWKLLEDKAGLEEWKTSLEEVLNADGTKWLSLPGIDQVGPPFHSLKDAAPVPKAFQHFNSSQRSVNQVGSRPQPNQNPQL
jgi:hypothetical protein